MVNPVDELERRGAARVTGLGPSTTRSADNAARIMSKDSPLMQRADTAGRQYGASRGMINSTMSGGAATTAALDYVVPLATQEASDLNSKQMNAAQISARSTDAAADRASRMSELNAQISANARQSEADRRAQAALQGGQIAANRDLAEMDAGMRTSLANLELESKERIAGWDIAQSNRDQATDMVANVQGLYNDTYRDIINNPDLDADDRQALMVTAGDRLNGNMQMTENLFQIDLNWEPVGVVSTPSPTGAPASPATGQPAPQPVTAAPTMTDAERYEQQRQAAQSAR